MKTSFLVGLLGLLCAALLAGATKVYRESVVKVHALMGPAPRKASLDGA